MPYRGEYHHRGGLRVAAGRELVAGLGQGVELHVVFHGQLLHGVRALPGGAVGLRLVILHHHLHAVKPFHGHLRAGVLAGGAYAEEACLLAARVVVFEEGLVARLLFPHIGLSVPEAQVEAYAPHLFGVFHVPFGLAQAVVADVLFPSAAHHLGLESHPEVAHHLPAAGGICHYPLKVELVALGHPVGMGYALQEPGYHRVLVLQVFGGKGRFLGWVEDGVEIVVETVPAADAFLEGDGTAAVVQVVETDFLAMEDAAQLWQQRVALVAFQLRLYGESAQHLQRLQPAHGGLVGVLRCVVDEGVGIYPGEPVELLQLVGGELEHLVVVLGVCAPVVALVPFCHIHHHQRRRLRSQQVLVRAAVRGYALVEG